MCANLLRERTRCLGMQHDGLDEFCGVHPRSIEPEIWIGGQSEVVR